MSNDRLTARDHVFDVVFWDDIGMPISDERATAKALGGSEFVLWLLARALARQGLKVAIWQGHVQFEERVSDGVHYLYRVERSPVRTRLLVHHRYSSGRYLRYVEPGAFCAMLTDRWGAHYESGVVAALTSEGWPAICLSQYHASLVPDQIRTRVIPNLVPDEIYESPDVDRDPHLFVYASSAQKGLIETLEAWTALKSTGRIDSARLEVFSPGYDVPQPSNHGVEGVDYIGPVPFAELLARLRRCAGLFYVNTFPETFGLVPVYAEASGARLHIRQCEGGAITEVVNSRLIVESAHDFEQLFLRYYGAQHGEGTEEPTDFRAEAVVPSWLKLMSELDG